MKQNSVTLLKYDWVSFLCVIDGTHSEYMLTHPPSRVMGIIKALSHITYSYSKKIQPSCLLKTRSGVRGTQSHAESQRHSSLLNNTKYGLQKYFDTPVTHKLLVKDLWS